MSPRIALLCPGLGRTFRGYERFASELFDAVQDKADFAFFPGSAPSASNVFPVGGVSRDSFTARALSLFSHDVYYWESLSFAVRAKSRLESFDILHYSEPPLNLAFTRFGPHAPRRLFSHALNMGVEHTLRCHHIHQTSPESFDAAIEIGVPAARMTLLPYGVHTEQFNPDRSADAALRAREEFGLPSEGPIVLCVAAVNSTHKRVNHLISELSSIRGKVHLVLCGALDEPGLLQQAKQTLGETKVIHLYLANDRMPDLYAACDLFVLPSIVEGFALGALEAQLSGLPVIVNDSPHFRWLLGSDAAVLVDMEHAGALGEAIDNTLAKLDEALTATRAARQRQVERYDWRYVTPGYLDMYSVVEQHSKDLIENILEH